jgi:hypothetical protein
MNNGEESEKDRVNILSNNRGNHTTIIVLAPVLLMGSAFLIFLLLVGGIVFFVVNRAGFLAFMPNVFTGTIELGKWTAIIVLAGLAIKFVFGSAIKDVFAPLVQVLLTAWGELRKDRVIHANDNFMAYTGDIKISHHEDIRQNYTIKQIDGPAPVPLLEGPKIRYARDLYETGKLFEAIRNGRIILGHGIKEDGTPTVWGIPRKDYFSTIAGGLPSSGKTTTAYWILVQQILIGARIILIDPHMHYQDENGNKSLTKELKPFQNSSVFPPIDASSPAAIMQRVKWMKNTIDARKRPGYIAKLSDMVILVIDEVNSVFELEDIRSQLANDLSYIQREGRKFGVHTMLVGHRWSKDDIGKVNIRTVASTIMAHKQNDEGQAAVLVGSHKHVKEVLDLTPGSYLFRGVNAMVDDDGAAEYRLTRVQTPMISAHDASWVLQLKQDVEAWLAGSATTSTTTSTPLRPHFGETDVCESRSESKCLEKPVEVESDPDLSPELLSLMHKVMEMEAQGVSTQKDVIAQVWGPEYTSGDRFYRAQSELLQIRKAIAQQMARLRRNASWH